MKSQLVQSNGEIGTPGIIQKFRQNTLFFASHYARIHPQRAGQRLEQVRRIIATPVPTEGTPEGYPIGESYPTNFGTRSDDPTASSRGEPC